MSKITENWHPSQNHINEFLECAANNNIERATDLLKIFPNDIINVTDDDGNTALHLAARNGHLDLVKALVNNGANLYTKNTQGKTAAQEAEANQRTTAGYVLGYADTEPTSTYLNQMDASLRTFLKIATGNAKDRQARMGKMLTKAPWMLNAKTEDGEVVKDIIVEQRARKELAKEIAEAAVSLSEKKAIIAEQKLIAAENRQKEREKAAEIGALRMEAATLRRKELLQQKASKAKSSAKKTRKKQLRASVLTEEFLKAREQEKIDKKGALLFSELPNNEAIDLDRTKARIESDQLESNSMDYTSSDISTVDATTTRERLYANDRPRFDSITSQERISSTDAEVGSERADSSVTRKSLITPPKTNDEKVIDFKNKLEQYLPNEKAVQEEFKTLTSDFEHYTSDPSLNIPNSLDLYIKNKKSRTSAKIARAVFGRKTDKDMLREAIGEFKKALEAKEPLSEIKPIDRWESWKKSKNNGHIK